MALTVEIAAEEWEGGEVTESQEPKRCYVCGQFAGELFTGYEHDRMAGRGRLWCESCAMEADARERPSPERGEGFVE